jgi:hypothetical protein
MFKYTVSYPTNYGRDLVSKPLHPEQCKILLEGTCHVDHEGFDLNEIEQAYYKENGILVTKDSTWYKDGGQDAGTNAILQEWFNQITESDDSLIIDHSHFVFKYPIVGEARNQILRFVPERPELLRLLSIRYKCGLDLCIDYLDKKNQIVEPIVHIEWDFESFDDLFFTSIDVKAIIDSEEWLKSIDTILHYNKLAKLKKVDAFEQADTRSMILFASKAYKLIPTL